MNKSKIVLFTASLALATALTLSCSSDDGDESEAGLSSGGTEISSSSADNDGSSSSSADNDGGSSSSVVAESSSSSQESSSSADNICGSETYNPETEFCSENIVYELCDGDEYDPEDNFCFENNIIELCGGDSYNPNTETCSNGNVTFTFTDTRDSKVYKGVKIGKQAWMAENLNYTPESGNSWCYSDNTDNCATYGRLYDWATAMDGAASSTATPSGVQGICPAGWHLPSYAELGVLVTYAGEYSTAGTKLKATSGWGTGNGTDDYGFSGVPGGIRKADGSFVNVGSNGYWWSASEYYGDYKEGWELSSSGASVSMNMGTMSSGFSVRCVRD